MKTKIAAAVTAAALLAVVTTMTVMAAAKTYKYKCYRCGLILEFDHPSVYKCPQDGTTMGSVN